MLVLRFFWPRIAPVKPPAIEQGEQPPHIRLRAGGQIFGFRGAVHSGVCGKGHGVCPSFEISDDSRGLEAVGGVRDETHGLDAPQSDNPLAVRTYDELDSSHGEVSYCLPTGKPCCWRRHYYIYNI